MPKDSSKDRDPAQLAALTSIRRGIHCAATVDSEPDREQREELDEIDINHLIKTLAEVTMAVAAHRLVKSRDAA